MIAEAVERQSTPASPATRFGYRRLSFGSISIEIPAGWEHIHAAEPGESPEAATFMKTDTAGSREVISVTAVDVPENMRAATVAEFAKWAWTQVHFVHPNAKLEESIAVRFAGADGWRWTYTIEDEGQVARALHVFNARNGKTYSIAYFAPADVFGRSMKQVDGIIASVQVTDERGAAQTVNP